MRLAGFILAFLALPAAADEGLWLYNQFPPDATRATLKEKYDFEPTPAFLDHLRLASVRIGGASGSFVSPRGLILTTRQAVAGCLTGKLAEDGFSGEMRCPDLDASGSCSRSKMAAPS